MNKMKQAIARIEQLEDLIIELEKMLSMENPISVDIRLNSAKDSKYYCFRHNPEEIKPFIQVRLDVILAELNPLKERMRVLTELLDGGKV